MGDIEFDIKELSERARTTPRTVHFYVQQGLLAPAGVPGPGARYGEGHVARLKLIRLLQKQHLPLAEIAKRLKGLTDAQVEGLLSEARARRAADSGSALEYIRSVLGEQSKRSVVQLDVPAFLRRDGGTAPARSAAAASAAAPAAVAATEPSRSQWERYTLTDGIELNVRRPLARTEQRMLTRLLDAARRIFHTAEEE